MYSVDKRDLVLELSDVPQSDTGAPLAVILSNEHRLLLAYLIREPNQGSARKSPRRISEPGGEHLVNP
jgi:hypothetical protein